MLTGMKNMVMKAWHEHYTLLTVSYVNLEGTRAAIRVTEKNRTPTVPNLYQGYLAYFPTPVAVAVVKMLTELASVSVTLAPGCGKNSDCIRRAFRAGFSGLMTDVFTFPLEGDVCQTRAVVEPAASVQFRVGDELGHLADTPRYDQAANADLMTQPTDAGLFIAQTGINPLVVSVGTTYGMYVPGVVPATDFRCLAEIFHCPSMPPASYDSSGTLFDQLQLCMMLRVTKISVGAVTFEWGKLALPHILCHSTSTELMDVLKVMEPVSEEVITPYLQANDAIGKA